MLSELSPNAGSWPQQGDLIRPPVRLGPVPATMGPMVGLELEQIEALELLGMTLAHLNDAEARVEVSARVPLLMAIRDKLAASLREEP